MRGRADGDSSLPNRQTLDQKRTQRARSGREVRLTAVDERDLSLEAPTADLHRDEAPLPIVRLRALRVRLGDDSRKERDPDPALHHPAGRFQVLDFDHDPGLLPSLRASGFEGGGRRHVRNHDQRFLRRLDKRDRAA